MQFSPRGISRLLASSRSRRSPSRPAAARRSAPSTATSSAATSRSRSRPTSSSSVGSTATRRCRRSTAPGNSTRTTPGSRRRSAPPAAPRPAVPPKPAPAPEDGGISPVVQHAIRPPGQDASITGGTPATNPSSAIPSAALHPAGRRAEPRDRQLHRAGLRRGRGQRHAPFTPTRSSNSSDPPSATRPARWTPPGSPGRPRQDRAADRRAGTQRARLRRRRAEPRHQRQEHWWTP